MNCQRALTILAGFLTRKLAFTADEIEELLARGLVVEADPRDLATLDWLAPAVLDLAGCALADPEAAGKLAGKLAELDKQLKSDWSRFTTGKDKLALREQERRLARRALAVVSDPVDLARLVALEANAPRIGSATYAPCPELGSELYAITELGARIGRELEARIARYADASLAAFVAAFDKAERKMAGFSGDIAKLAGGIGPVRKNAHQVVIGLAKTGAPPAEALGLYRSAMSSEGEHDVAVTCARNAATFGGPREVAQRLESAQQALRRAGVMLDDVAKGAAKTLLPFDDPDVGAARFVAIARLLEAQNLTRGDATIKGTARLMPADGPAEEVVQRAALAYNQLPATLDRQLRTSTAIALAAMVATGDAVLAVVQRFGELQHELHRRRVSVSTALAVADALECVACPGTPVEVVATVRALIAKLAAGREARREDVAIAVAFAKRFAY